MICTTATARKPLNGPDDSAGITIADIEARVAKLKAGWPEGATLQETSALFAMLKVGSSVNRLVWFTKYDRTFVYDLVEALRRTGKLMTGIPSATFVLSRCLGSEELIEAITGSPARLPESCHQAVFAPPSTAPRKGVKRMSANPTDGPVAPTPAHQSEASSQCWCGREANHRGLHKTKGKTIPPSPPIGQSRPSFWFSVTVKTPDGEYKQEGTSRAKMDAAMGIVGQMLGD